nr:hypothetical protein [Tanacetum cinerariifolium]
MLIFYVKTQGTYDDEAGSSRSKHSRHETVEEVLLPQVHHEFLLWEGCNRDAKSRAFNINEPIYAELCYEFYSTYEFGEVCIDDELQIKKIIKFRLGERAYSLTLLEFTRRLRMYQAVELEEEGFNVYFEGSLCSDEHFNTQDYWLSISREENLGLSRSHTFTIMNLILRVIQKIITYSLYQRTTSLGDCKMDEEERSWNSEESQICCGQFILKISRKYKVLREDVVRSLSALIYYRDLDTTTLRDLIDSYGNLILEVPQPGVPIVGIPRSPRVSIQDLYDRMGMIKIRQ